MAGPAGAVNILPLLSREEPVTHPNMRLCNRLGVALIIALFAVLGLEGCARHAGPPVAAAAVQADPQEDIAAGRDYALRACADCHNVTLREPRLVAGVGAPDFYAIAAERTTTRAGLNVFLLTPHATMPNFIIADQDRRNVIAYILTFRPPGTPPGI